MTKNARLVQRFFCSVMPHPMLRSLRLSSQSSVAATATDGFGFAAPRCVDVGANLLDIMFTLDVRVFLGAHTILFATAVLFDFTAAVTAPIKSK